MDNQIIAVLSITITSIFIIYLTYRIYLSFKSSAVGHKNVITLQQQITSAKVSKTLSGAEIPASNISNQFSLSFWVKIDNYRYRYKEPKYIFKRSPNQSIAGNPDIYLEPLNNNLVVRLRLQTSAQLEKGNEYTTNDKYFDDTNRIAENFNNIADNSAPLQSVSYSENFFQSISGNTLENFVDETTILPQETTPPPFTRDNYKAQLITFLDGLCNLIAEIEKDKTATDIVVAYDKLFDAVIEILKTKSTSLADLSNSSISSLQTLNTDETVNTIITSILYLNNMNTDMTISKDDWNDILHVVNNHLSGNNCPLYLEPSKINNINDLYQFVINLIREKGKKLITAIAKKMNVNLVEVDDVNNPEFDKCLLYDIPLQKWCHVVISIYNNAVDIYLDGALSSSCVLAGYPDIGGGDIYTCLDGGFEGSIGNIQYVNGALSQDEVYKMYRSGPDGNAQSRLSAFFDSIF